MKGKIYINRHKVRANKKTTKQTGIVKDEAAIAIRTSKGVNYRKRVELAPGIALIQDAENAICTGATIWIEVDNINSIIY